MSEESVEVLRNALAAWNSRDMAARRELLDPDVVVRGGKISYQESFWDHAEALEALGLSE